MGGVVALDLVAGPRFVDELVRIWERGDAVLPVDRRLPPPARATLMAALRPTSIIDEDGERSLDGESTGDGDALVVATSGTGGEPKGVVLTHDAVRASARATNAHLDVTPSDHWLACLPLSHIGGLSVITKALEANLELTVHPQFDAVAVERAARDGATLVSLVATAALGRIDASLFRRVVLGGSRPPAELPPNVVVTYGLTETGSGIVYDGRPLTGVDVMLDDAGQIHVRGPMLLRCYRFGGVPLDADGWFATNDIGTWRPDGRLMVHGRRGDLIVTGGENVWPDAVERALADHEGIVEVAVAGVPDPEWGRRVVAWVVPADHDQPPALESVRAHVSARLPGFMAPREVRVVGSLPRTALGKVVRGALPGSRAGESDAN